jgi:hypothetical protein
MLAGGVATLLEEAIQFCTIQYDSNIVISGVDDILQRSARHALYKTAKEHHPARWARHTRDWSPVGAVTLNPERDSPSFRSTFRKSLFSRWLHKLGDNYLDARRKTGVIRGQVARQYWVTGSALDIKRGPR